MTVREQLEAAIEDALEVADSDIITAAIALLDEIDGDPDLEDDEREGDAPHLLPAVDGVPMWGIRDLDDEIPELPPLMDGGFGYSLGRLPVYDRCPCCGHLEHAGHLSPVTEFP